MAFTGILGSKSGTLGGVLLGSNNPNPVPASVSLGGSSNVGFTYRVLLRIYKVLGAVVQRVAPKAPQVRHNLAIRIKR